jgi:Peptidase family M28
MGDANRTGGGNVDGVQDLDDLTKISPRRAGSEAERRAARHLEQRLQALGREARAEPTRVRPDVGLTGAIHAAAGVVASVLSVYAPLAGLALAAATTISAFGELTGTFQLVRLLMPVRASQNLVSDEDNGKPGLIVLVAHYDAPVTGMLLDRRLRAWPRATIISLAVICVCAIGRVLGIESTGLTVLQFIPTVVLIAITPLFVDLAISDTDDGAADNAAGVATVLRVAESHSGKLTHFDLMVVFTGASANLALGMRAWLKRHRKELNPEATAVISVDNLSSGTSAYAAKEGPVFASRMHPTLVELARGSGAAYTSNELSDAYLARAAGLPAIRVSTTERGGDAVDPDALARVHDYVGALLEHIDEEIGPYLG